MNPRNFLLSTVLLMSAQTWAAEVTVGFSPARSGPSAEAVVIGAIAEARKEIRVAAYSFTSKEIASALVDAHRRGIDVKVVLDKTNRPKDPQKYSAATFLANAGVPMRINSHYAIMHNKFMVIDRRNVETGSFNYTSAAAHRNAENAVYVRDDVELAGDYAREWAALWNEAELEHTAQKPRPASPATIPR